jgi:hypothetical protein
MSENTYYLIFSQKKLRLQAFKSHSVSPNKDNSRHNRQQLLVSMDHKTAPKQSITGNKYQRRRRRAMEASV